jgi:glycosyltransferase involved in cell wall biosynthesis
LPCILGKGVAIANEAAAAGAAIAVTPDIESVAAAIKELLGNPVRCTEMSERARELAQREYSTEAMGERLVTLYSRVVRLKK